MSNLYANKVFSEHPIALWSFDEEAHYIDLLQEADRQLDNWPTATNLTIGVYPGSVLDGTPFPASPITQAYPTNDAVLECTLTSDTVWAPADIYTNVPVTASIYMYFPDSVVNYVDFGSTDGSNLDFTRHVISSTGSKFWVKLTHQNLLYGKLYIRINYAEFSNQADTTWLFNGLSLGQYSEPVSSDSLGVTVQAFAAGNELVDGGFISDSDGIGYYKTQSIGAKEKDMYYLSRDNKLLAFNDAIPIVYGSNYSTTLVPIDSPNEGAHPSLIFDGDGFLSELGKKSTYTLEFWMRIGNTSMEPKKIFGNLGGHSDGLWIAGNVMTFVVGERIRLSCNVGSFDEPMLVHLVCSPTYVSIIINGETVASTQISNDTVLSFASTENRYLGFWSYAELGRFEVDCMSLFGYTVPELVARRRFIWGQGVTNVDVVNSQYGGVGVFADYSAAAMTSNASYNNNFFWASGSTDRLSFDGGVLKAPVAPLPELNLDGKSRQEWYDDLLLAHAADVGEDWEDEKFFTFRPQGIAAWDSLNCYAMFNRLGDFLENPYGVFLEFSSYSAVASSQPIAVLFNSFYPGKKIVFELNQTRTEITTTFYSGEDPTVISTDAFDNTKRNILYINLVGTLTEAGEPIPDDMRKMLINSNALRIQAAGDGTTTFSGRFYRLGMITENNFLCAIQQHVGTTNSVVSVLDRVDETQFDEFNIVSYTWIPQLLFNSMYEDVGIKGYWQDHISLSQLAGVVYDINGNETIGVDNLQFNIGFPRSNATLNAPELINSALPTSVPNDLVLDPVDDPVVIDTAQAPVRTLISFQKNSDGVVTRDNLTGFHPPTTSSTIYLQNSKDFSGVAYEVVDGTTILPPQTLYPSKLIAAIYLEFTVPGVYTFPVQVKSMELSSYSSNSNSFTEVKSKSGKAVYPVISNGTFYDQIALHPFRVYKKNFPYLHLGRESGFISTMPRETDYDAGFRLEIPEGQSVEYRLDHVGFWMRRNKRFPNAEQNLLVFAYGTKKILLTIQDFQPDAPESRGIIRAYDQDGNREENLTFFQNGNLVANPIVAESQWTAISLSFKTGGISLGGSTGKLTFCQEVTFNNMSYFASRGDTSTSVEYRPWSEVDDENWAYWSTDPAEAPNDWYGVLVKGSVETKTKELCQVVYKTYVGTQVLSINSEQPFLVTQGKILLSSDMQWVNTTLDFV